MANSGGSSSSADDIPNGGNISFPSITWQKLGPGTYKITDTCAENDGSCNSKLRCKVAGNTTDVITVGKFDNEIDMKTGTHSNPGPDIIGKGAEAINKTFVIYENVPEQYVVQCGYGLEV